MKSSASGCKYFHGMLTDGTTSLRVVGFNSKLQNKLADFKAHQKAVALSDCEVKEGKFDTKLEVHLRNNTEIYASPSKSLDPSSLVMPEPSTQIELTQLSALENFQEVSVKIKVIDVNEPERVKNNLLKQECTIADSTRSAKLTLWEDNVDVLAPDNSYELTGLQVRSFKGIKYLSVSRDNFSVKEISDIGAITNEDPEAEKFHSLSNVTVRGVRLFDSYNACYSCNAKVSITDNAALSKCNKCGTLQRTDRCSTQVTAKIELYSETTEQCVTLVCFSPFLEEICSSNVSIEALLFSEHFDVTYSDANIITGIQRF